MSIDIIALIAFLAIVSLTIIVNIFVHNHNIDKRIKHSTAIINDFLAKHKFDNIYQLKIGFYKLYYIDMTSKDRYDISEMWGNVLTAFESKK